MPKKGSLPICQPQLASRLAISIALFTISVASPAICASTSSADISSTAVAGIGKCTNWQAIGVCYWLRCGLSGCGIKTSPKVGHYRPDLVVSVFRRHDEHPWQEADVLYGSVMRESLEAWARFAGASSPDALSEGRSALRFHEADALGHPLTDFAASTDFPYVCDTQTLPLKLYWSSALDATEWRSGTIDKFLPPALIPGWREVGSWPLRTWGAIYPRTGWTIQSDPAKAAALIAQRAGDIVTRTETHRITLPFESRGQAHWPPKSLFEGNAKTGSWQMVSPQEGKSCDVFGVNDFASAASWGGGRIATDRTWIWNLWRPYKCCERAGQVFLRSTDLVEYP